MNEFNLTFAEVVEKLKVGQYAENTNETVIRKLANGSIVQVVQDGYCDNYVECNERDCEEREYQYALTLTPDIVTSKWRIKKDHDTEKLDAIEEKMMQLNTLIREYVYYGSSNLTPQERAKRVTEKTLKYMTFYG